MKKVIHNHTLCHDTTDQDNGGKVQKNSAYVKISVVSNYVITHVSTEAPKSKR